MFNFNCFNADPHLLQSIRRMLYRYFAVNVQKTTKLHVVFHF